MMDRRNFLLTAGAATAAHANALSALAATTKPLISAREIALHRP